MAWKALVGRLRQPWLSEVTGGAAWPLSPQSWKGARSNPESHREPPRHLKLPQDGSAGCQGSCSGNRAQRLRWHRGQTWFSHPQGGSTSGTARPSCLAAHTVCTKPWEGTGERAPLSFPACGSSQLQRRSRAWQSVLHQGRRDGGWHLPPRLPTSVPTSASLNRTSSPCHPVPCCPLLGTQLLRCLANICHCTHSGPALGCPHPAAPCKFWMTLHSHASNGGPGTCGLVTPQAMPGRMSASRCCRAGSSRASLCLQLTRSSSAVPTRPTPGECPRLLNQAPVSAQSRPEVLGLG